MMEEEKPKTSDDIMENKPKLEIERTYKIDPYPFGLALRAGCNVECYPSSQIIGSGRAIEAKYLGHVNKGHYCNEHVFVFEDENKEKNYAFFEDYWIREIQGIITYPFISSSSTKYFTKVYFKEELLKKLEENDSGTRHVWERESKLLEILEQLGEQI